MHTHTLLVCVYIHCPDVQLRVQEAKQHAQGHLAGKTETESKNHTWVPRTPPPTVCPPGQFASAFLYLSPI